MSTLFILNDPPYGTERSFNALRLAKTLVGKGEEVWVFLMADAVACAKAGQKVPQGFYNLELMVNAICRKGDVLLCGTCMDARGITEAELVPGAQRSTLEALAQRTLDAEGFFARAICHEVDHLHGILFIDKPEFVEAVEEDEEGIDE